MNKISKNILLNTGSAELKRAEIKKYFLETVALEDSLFQLLLSETSFLKKSEPLRHPLIFYYGHTFTFYINKLYTGQYIPNRVDPTLEALFSVGVDEMSWDDLNESNYQWPTVSKVKTYRETVKNLVLKFIEETDFKIPITWESPMWCIMMGIEHQHIHIETSSVLIRQHALSEIQQNSQWAPCPDFGNINENRMKPVKAQSFNIGKDFEHPLYGWDNEYGNHRVQLKNFEASEFLVSNGEFKKFIDDNGYSTDNFWTEEGKKWKNFKKSEYPIFWVKDGNEFKLRCIDREIPMPWSWPAEVNYLEAKAFCNWKSKKENKNYRLPTEDEWYALYYNEPSDRFNNNANINLEYYPSSCPVNKFKQGEFYDVTGNVWQWTETPIYPFHGFKVHPLYDDFSVPTFDGRHNLIKGGSWISTGNETTMESRYAFRRHFFQHAGFRYVISENKENVQLNPYETDQLLSQYCEFHYGDEYFNTPNFPKNCIATASKYFHLLSSTKKALDLGCALGRSTLELSPYFENVVGIDFSTRFIEKANSILDEKILRYAICNEGDIMDYYERKLPEYLLKHPLNNINFYQADACNLPIKFKNLDLIFAGNLIDRLHTPRNFLQNIHEYINNGGLLILTSPYTWLEEYTPKDKWVGGYKRNAENINTLKGLTEELSAHFELVDKPIDIPFVLRETNRKFQHTIAQMTIWKKVK